MFRSYTKETLTALALITIIFYSILLIICIILAGLQFNQTNVNWLDEGAVKHIGRLQMSSVVIAFVESLFGILLLVSPSKSGSIKIMKLFYVVFHFLITLLVLSCSIIFLVEGTIKKDDLSKVCKNEYAGVFEPFRHLDDLFMLIDESLCSNQCKCHFNNFSALEELYDYYEENNKDFAQFIVTDDESNGVTSFDKCSLKTIDSVLTKYYEQNAEHREKVGNIRIDKLASYWEKVERKFKCSGWCEIHYKPIINYHETEKRKIIKYLFSDVNRGLVSNRGCMSELTDWLPKMMLKFGSVLLVVSLVMIFDCFLLSSIFCDCFKKQIIFSSVIMKKEEASNHLVKSVIMQSDPSEEKKEQKEEEKKEEEKIEAN